MSGLPVGVPKLLAGSTAFGVEKSMSSAVERTICITSLAVRVTCTVARVSSRRGRPCPTAMPVASDEQLSDGTLTKVWPPKFVQPLSAR